MQVDTDLSTVLLAWKTLIGPTPVIINDPLGREIWHVRAADGSYYFLKRLGPWRNLPLADEMRVHQHLSHAGVPVVSYLPTDEAAMFAGELHDSFVLMPSVPNHTFPADEVRLLEPTIGVAMARLHIALGQYPRSVNSYTEGLATTLASIDALPPDLDELFAPRRAEIISDLSGLPAQLVHGDMTPENILLASDGAVSGFIDFDHLPLAPRIWDIGKYLSRRLRTRWRDDLPVSEASRIDHLSGFLRAYRGISPLTDSEIGAIPSAIAAANVIEVDYFAKIAAGILPRRMLPDHMDVLQDSIDAAYWHLTNWETVEHAVSG